MITISGPLSPSMELDKLREAYESLNDVVRGIESAVAAIDCMNFGTAKDHLNAAKWHVGEVKKRITMVGQSRNQKADRSEHV